MSDHPPVWLTGSSYCQQCEEPIAQYNTDYLWRTVRGQIVGCVQRADGGWTEHQPQPAHVVPDLTDPDALERWLTQ